MKYQSSKISHPSFNCFLMVVVLFLIPVFFAMPASAEEPAEAKEIFLTSEDEVYFADSIGGLTSQEAAEGYIRQQLGLVAGELPSVGSANAGARLEGGNANLYNILVAYASEIAAGTRSSTHFEIPASQIYDKLSYTAEDLGVASWASSGVPSDEAFAAFEAVTALDVPAVTNALLSDHPYEMYWFDITAGSAYGLPSSIWYDDTSIYYYADDYALIEFYVSSEYSVSGEQGTTEYNTSYGRAVRAAAANALAIREQHRFESDLSKLAAYRDAICDLNEYNYAAAEDESTPYGNPWQLIWVFDGDPDTRVVCEGYAKAFQYLCDISEFRTPISVYCVGGGAYDSSGGGAHMWNIVSMGDGQNYHTDITWYDGGFTDLFLVGNATVYQDENNTGYQLQANGETVVYIPENTYVNLYTTDQLQISSDAFDPADYPLANTAPSVQTIPYTVQSVWVDTDGTTPIEPDDLEVAVVYIKRNETETGEVIVLNKANNWTATANVEYVNEASYGVSRVEVEGYTKSTHTEIVNGSSFLTTITFKKKSSGDPTTTDLTVQAAFVDEDGVTPYVPVDVTEVPFRLYRNGTQIGDTMILNEDNAWRMTITGLPVADGIVYSVEEDVPDGFEKVSITHVDNVITITNRKLPEGSMFSIPVYVQWFDTDGETPIEAPVDALLVYLYWDGMVVENKMVYAADNWAGIFENLEQVTGAVYNVNIDAQENFDATISAVQPGDASKGFRIRLKKQETAPDRVVSIPVSIEWLDANGSPSTPDDDTEVEVWLLKDGERFESMTLNAYSDWLGTFEDITLTKGSTWFVEEVVPEGYTMVFRGANTDNKPEDGFTIRNQEKSTATISIPVSASFVDADGTTPLTPESGLELTVWLTVNQEKTGDSLILNAAKGWTDTFTGISVVNNSSYGVTVDPLDNYTSEISAVTSGDPTKGYQITNKRKPSQAAVNIPVIVLWKDTDGTTTLTPEAGVSVTAYLLKDGSRTGDSVTITASDGWQGTFENILPETGSSYSVQLGSVSGFRGEVQPNGSGALAEGFTATLIKKVSSQNGATPRVVKEGVIMTLRMSDQGENASYQWQYSVNGGNTWQNCTGTGNDTTEFQLTITNEWHGRQIRCAVSIGTQTLYTEPNVYIVVRSEDPYCEDVLTLPQDLTVVEPEAFVGIDAFTVIIPAGVQSIGSRAFADCEELRYISISDSIAASDIADDAFEGDLVIFLCSNGSGAAEYAEAHNIPIQEN